MRIWKCSLALTALTLQASLVFAQNPVAAQMPAIAAALGVQCNYCHGPMGVGGRGAKSAPGQRPTHIEIARNMMVMVKDLNERLLPAATGKDADQNLRIQCATCHRGVLIPGQLSDIMTQTAFADGGDAAAEKYRDLRKQYYGRQAYDFGEDTLVTAATALSNGKPDAAITLLKLNLEFYPQSVHTYTQLAYAYTRTLDDDDAIAALEKAIEISPDNSIVKGQLEQLKSFHRKR